MATLTLVGAADEPDYSGHAMVALYPPLEAVKRYAITGGLVPEKMHVTMAYLGLAEDVDKAAVQKALESLPVRQPFVAKVSGHARFVGGEEDVLVALVDSPHIERLRIDLLKALEAQGVTVPGDHGFVPHMTLAYMDPQALTPLVRLEPGDLGFDAVWLKHGKDKQSYSFQDPVSENIRTYARTAYAQGWAASGGPMTDQVAAGCIAAMDLCSENAHDPQVLELALHLGNLEGVWAQVFARRDRLFADRTAVVKQLWQQLVKGMDVPGAVALFRQQMGLSEAVDRGWIRRAKKAAREAARRLLGWLPGTTAWQAIREGMRSLVAASKAEGYAGAIAVAASEQHMIGFNFDIAFQHAYDALENLGQTWAESDAWLERMLGRAADEFGRTLGDLAAAGADYEQMIAAGLNVLQDTVADKEIVGFIVDWAASTGLSRGALDLYASEGVQKVTWMTAGDGRVCPVCERNGEGSPYLLADFPTMPAHPLCVIGSTRIVASDVTHGLSSNAVQHGVVATGNGGLTAASAVTETERDFGRGNIRAVTDREYVGQVVTIRTALGHELTVTPNHPVATRRGWVPVSELHVGDHVISSTGPEWIAASVNPNVDQVPPCIEDVAKTFPVHLGPVPTAAQDFHGDGSGSDVHVVRTDRFLRDHVAMENADSVGGAEPGSDVQLCGGDVLVDPSFTGDGAGAQLVKAPFGAAHGSVSGIGESGTFFGTGVGHACVHGFGSVAGLDASGQKPAADYAAIDAEGFCEGLLALSANVAADEVVELVWSEFSGHVYNLETTMGYYIGNGILTHNCRCVASAEFDLSPAYAGYFG